MATIWKILKKYASQLGITYNEADTTYNQANVNYAGKLSTQWSIRQKS